MDNSVDDFSGDEYEQDMEECEDTQVELEQDKEHFGIEEQIDAGTVEGLFVEGVVPNERNWSKEEGTDEEGLQEYLEGEEEEEEEGEGEEEKEKDAPHVEGEEGETLHEKNTTEKTGTDTVDDTGDNSFLQQKGEENTSNLPHANATDEKEDTLHNDTEKKEKEEEEEEEKTKKKTYLKTEKKTEEVVHPKSKNVEQEKVQKLFIKNTETNYLKNIWNPKNIDLTQLKYENYKNKNILFPSLSPTNIPIPGREKEKVEMLHMDTEKHGYKYNNGLNPAEGYLFVYPHVSNNTIPPKIRKKRLPCC